MLRRLTTLAVLASAVAGLTASAADAGPARGSGSASVAGVCDGVPGCRVVARVDVNGDGSRDDIGLAARGSGAARVVVRVRTAPGRIASLQAAAGPWSGSRWQGAAHLDGRRGAELVVGDTQGAHTQYYRALTWRAGRLVTLGAPGPGVLWVTDGAVFVSLGWQQLPRDPAGCIRRLAALRAGSSVHDPFRGTITRYQWSARGWRTVATRTVFPLTDRAADGWGGFHVPGLPRW